MQIDQVQLPVMPFSFMLSLWFLILFFPFGLFTLILTADLCTALGCFRDNIFLVTWLFVWFTYGAFTLFNWLFEKLTVWQFGFIFNCLKTVACCFILRGRFKTGINARQARTPDTACARMVQMWSLQANAKSHWEHLLQKKECVTLTQRFYKLFRSRYSTVLYLN